MNADGLLRAAIAREMERLAGLPKSGTDGRPGGPAAAAPGAVVTVTDGEIASSGLIRSLSEAIRHNASFAQDRGGKLYCYAAGVYRPNGAEFVRQQISSLLHTWGQDKRWRIQLNNETIEHVRIHSPQLWERPPLEVVNLKNGLLDLSTGQLQSHTPDHLTSVQLPVEFQPGATCPGWDGFIAATFPDDAYLAGVGFQIPALLMVPYTSTQKTILLTGEGGNGKSTYLAACMAFVGRRNCSSLSLHRLEGDKFAASRLLGKLANVCPDLPSEHLASTSVFKAITGEDPVPGEYKFRESFEFIPFARLVFSANHPPKSSDSSDAFFRRWLVIPFERTFDPDRDNYVPRDELDARLADAGELSGVLNQALKQYRAIRTRGLTETPSMRRAWEQLRQATDPFSVWLDRETVALPDAQVPKGELMIAYNRDCEKAGRPPMTQQSFGRAVKRARPQVQEAQRTVHSRLQWCYIGLGLQAEDLTGQEDRSILQ